MNTHSAVAARPILASSLLPPGSEDDDRSTSSSEDEDGWRLASEIYGDEGSKKPAAAIVSAGRVLGISSLILSIDPGKKAPNGREYVQEWVDEVRIYLLAKTQSTLLIQPIVITTLANFHNHTKHDCKPAKGFHYPI